MSELAERVKQTLVALRDVFKSPAVPVEMTLEEGTKFCDEKYAAIIEQALLAERRLAKLEDAEIAAKIRDDRRMEYTGREIATTYNDGLMYGTELVEQALRAAAEKEVGK